MNLIVELKLRNTIANQNNKCFKCGNEIKFEEELYFRMDQKIKLYEVYCYKCGLIQCEKDKEDGKKIEKI